MPTTTINLTGQALSKTDDTNVTLTLTGTPLTALLKTVGITVGWTGTLAATRGGTGLSALGTAGQLLKVNAGGTALEYFTPSYGTGTVTAVSVASSNGFTGSSSGGATPAITLTTSITGILIGNGTALTTSAELTWNGTTKDFSVGDATKATLNVLGSAEIVEINSVNGLSVNNAAGTSEWLFIDPASSIGGFGDLSASGNGSTLIFDDTTQTLRWNKSILGIRGVDYTFPAANASGVLTNNGSGTLSWAAASSGITVGTTTITGGTTRNIPYNLAGVYQEASKDLYYQLATPYSHVFAAGRSGTITGVNASVFGYNAAFSLTSGTNNTAVGYNALYAVTTTNYSTAIGASALENSTGASNTAVGYYSQGIASGAGANNTSIGDNALRGRTSGNRNVALGAESLFTLTTGSYNVAIGFEACYTGNLSGTIGIGYFANPTTSNTGVLGSGEAESRIDNWFLNGVVYAAPYSTVINGCGGSGTNIAGASLTIAGGKGTGTGAGGNIVFQTSTVGASGTTLQTLATRFTIEKLRVTAAVPIKLMGYTVATLPAAPSVGDTAYCTDLLTPTFFTVAVGGGAVTGMVFYDGTIWKT